jgi:hypothetical protein
MASARPVVSTRIAGVPEQIVDGQTGFICEPGDERGLAEALEKLLRSPELRRQFGEAGQQRLRSEFGVDSTVKALLAQYERHVRPAGTAPTRDAGLAVLVHEWPTTERHEAELRQLADAVPTFRAWAFHAGGAAPDEWRRTLPRCDFLPDAMIVEAEWAQEKDLRHQLETIRNELGSKLPTEEFLRHARYALSLRKFVKRDGVRHIHAAGTRELLTAWLLRRLCGVTVSATIEDKPAIHGDPLLILARDCAALRSGADPFTEAGEPRPKVTLQRSGRGFDAAWLARLHELANAQGGFEGKAA